MRDGKPSTTAAAVAYARALGTAVSDPDPIAPRLLPRPWGVAASSVLSLGRAGRALRWVHRAASGGMIDHVNLRTAAIDASLRRAVLGGVDQLVVLGAGLDARAWRLPALAGTDVLEIDHPATQATKRARIGNLIPTARTVEFVAVDFERDDLREALADSTHERNRKTVWIWEGVTPYLDPAAIDATLGVIAECSARGSVLLMSYAATPLVPAPLSGFSGIVRSAFAALGEPLRGAMSPEQASARLAKVEFDMNADTDHAHWVGGRRIEPTLAYPFRSERLAEAVRR